MSAESVSHLSDVDRTELTGLLREALASPALQVLSWEAQAVHGGAEGGSAVYRLQGQAEAQGSTVPWSLILKVVERRPEASDPQGIWYYRREALAYQSGLLQRLPGKIRAPHCYAVQERPDGSTRLWLEDVRDEVGETWPLAHYGEVARQLGRWNGAYLVGEPPPSEPWITRGWLRRYVENAAPGIDFIRHNPGHPVVRSWFPGTILPYMLALWDERERYFDALDRLPQVLCHQDAFRRNLFARHDGTVAIDWSFAGIAAVGGELAALVMATAGFFEVPPGRVAELDQICFEGYMQGLRDAGWEGPARLVRLGFALTSHLRYTIGAVAGEALPGLLDQDRRAQTGSAINRPVAELARAWAALMAYFQTLFMKQLRMLGMGNFLRYIGGTARYAVTLRRGKG